MSLWRQVSRGLRTLTRRSAADRDVNDEIQDYLDHATAEHVARGLSPDAARRAARLDLGGVATVTEQVRSYGWENLIATFAADVSYALRGLRAAPGFAAVVIVTLALGVGGTTAIFSAVNPILFNPLSYPGADRLVMITETRSTGARADGTFGMYRWLTDRSRSLEALAVIKPWQPTASETNNSERLSGQRVSASYFQVLGVKPALGQGFSASDDVQNGPNVVILSDALWRRRFAADRTIVGRAISLDDLNFLVIGVMPEHFEDVLAPAAELWAPLQYGMSQGRAWGHHLRTVGRLKPGVGVAAAAREINEIGQAGLNALHPATYGRDVIFATMWLGDDLVRDVKPTLLTVLGAVSLVLVIACVNVTNLLLARGVRRRSEFALRVALGAGQSRLVRQLLAESLVLALLGGIVGMAIAAAGVPALVALAPPGLPRAAAIRVDGSVFLFALGVSTLVGLVVGLIPAFQTARSDPQQDLLHASKRTTGGHRRTRSTLVVAEVALALVLLVASGLLLRSLQRLFAIPSGFDSSRALTLQVQSTRRFDNPGASAASFDQVLDAVRSVPGVTNAEFTSQLPLSGDRDEYGVHFDIGTGQCCSSFRYAVSPGYLNLMRVPLVQGRLFDARDVAGGPLAAIVSQSLATHQFGPESPIGKRLRIGPTDGPQYTIVGVVGDLKQLSLAAADADAVYTTASQSPNGERTVSFVVRTDGEPERLATAISRAVWSIDQTQIINRVATLDALLAATAAERRFALILFEAFALAALVLAVAGIYGILAGSVAERTREIGVRSVLGATRASIVGLVIRQGLTLAVLGIAIGLVGAAVASRLLIALLFRVSPLDPVTYIGVATLLATMATLACGVPAWRAARVDPASTLRAE
jgi:putative ABC transport system permease protein